MSPRSIWEQEAFAYMHFSAPGREVREAGACSGDHLADDLVVCSMGISSSLSPTMMSAGPG